MLNTIAHQINTRLSWVNLQHQTVASGQHHAPTDLTPTLPVRDWLNTTLDLHTTSPPLHVIQRQLSSRPDRNLYTTLTELSHVLLCRNKNLFPKITGSTKADSCSSSPRNAHSYSAMTASAPSPGAIRSHMNYVQPPHTWQTAAEGTGFLVKAVQRPPLDGVTPLNSRTPPCYFFNFSSVRISVNADSRKQLNCRQSLLIKLIQSKSRHRFINNVSSATCYPLSYRVPVRERYGSTLLPATREQHDQNCTQSQ